MTEHTRDDYRVAADLYRQVEQEGVPPRSIRVETYRRLRAQGWTMERIGASVGLSRSRISQVLRQAQP
jgi:DNA-directed RNA polymerase sigma subunit (sigma70/sigma32)